MEIPIARADPAAGPDDPAGRGWGRRRVLGGAALGGVAWGLPTATLAGCGLFDSGPTPPPAPDPVAPLLDQALALAAAHDRARAAAPELAAQLTTIADAHRAHAAELGRLIGGPPPPSAPAAPPSNGDAKAVRRTLRAAEQQAQRAAGAACRQAPAGRAALLGSIAAACASHAEALR